MRETRSEQDEMRGVKRLFVLRPDNLGDVVLFTGALRRLREYYADAHITICIRRYVGPLLADCPHVDEIVFWEDLHSTWPAWTGRIRGLRRLELAIRRWQIRRRHACDVALLPLRAPSAPMHAVMRSIPADEKYGISGCYSNQTREADSAAEPIYTERLRLQPAQEDAHEMEITCEFLRMLGLEVDTDGIQPEFWTGAEDRAWAEAAMPATPDHLLLVIAPGVTAPIEKAYPGDRYGDVVTASASPALRVILLGGPADRAICRDVEFSLSGARNVASVTNLAGQTTVGQMIECLRRADVVLGPDSAPMHVGIALGRPTVTILGGGQPGRFQPWGDPERNRIVSKPMGCFGCNWNCRYPTMLCVQDIRPDEVGAVLGAALLNAPGTEATR